MGLSFKEIRDIYWKYYISLEKQFIETERYVEFDYDYNGKTYSMEFMKLFQAVCSEIDVVGKKLAQCINSSFKPNKYTGINEWWFHVSNAFPCLNDNKYCLFEKKELQPWANYVVIENPNKKGKRFILNEAIRPKGSLPPWWNDYNSVKHNRTGEKEKNKRTPNYTNANLKNLLISFSALYSLETLLMEYGFSEEDSTISTELESRLFKDKLPFYTCHLAVKSGDIAVINGNNVTIGN